MLLLGLCILTIRQQNHFVVNNPCTPVRRTTVRRCTGGVPCRASRARASSPHNPPLPPWPSRRRELGVGTRTGFETSSGSDTNFGNGWKNACRRRLIQARCVGVICAFKKKDILVINNYPHVFRGHGFEIGSRYNSKTPGFVVPCFECHTLPRV